VFAKLFFLHSFLTHTPPSLLLAVTEWHVTLSLPNPLCPASTTRLAAPTPALHANDARACDLLLSMLCAALRSNRWLALVSPFPAVCHSLFAASSYAPAAITKPPSSALREALEQCLTPTQTQDATTSQQPLALAALRHWLALAPLRLRQVKVDAELYHVPFEDDAAHGFSFASDPTSASDSDVKSSELTARLQPQPQPQPLPASNGGYSLPDYQFEVVDGADACTAQTDPHFTELAAKHGSFVAYHGSPLPNWHCIARCGLKNLSYTKESTSGAMLGAGVYFTDDLRLARMFSQVWVGLLFGCLLLVVSL
jgi:hypothetical protein